MSTAELQSCAKALYYCPCDSLSNPAAHEGGTDALQPPLDPDSPLLPLRAFPFCRLYFCDDCGMIRCPRCVLSEPAGYYCPNCLFEVPTASVRSDKNRCARNCFECPVCTHVLTVMEAARHPSEDSATKPFYLACTVCYWDSREIGWTFERAMGLSAQIEGVKKEDAMEREFARLVEHFSEVQRKCSPQHGTSSALGSLGYSSGLGAHFSSIRASAMSKLLLDRTPKTADLPEYHASGYTEDDTVASAEVTYLQNAHQVGELKSKLEPERVRLSMKLAKRCRKCRHIMIKPESKAQAIRFKIKLVAANYIPSITILRALSPSTPLKVAPYAAGTPFTLGLRFINPVYSELDLELSTPLTVRRGASGGGNKAGPEDSQALVEVPAPRITLAPYTELWEYGDEETTNDVVSDACTKVDKSRGIVDVRGNSVTLLFRVSPLRPAKDLVIPLLVKYSHKSMDVDIDNEGEDVGTQPTAADSVTRGSFWVYLCLGPVRSQAVGDPQ